MSAQRSNPLVSDRLIEPVVWDRIRYFHHIERAVAYFEEHLAERTSERAVAAAACLEQTAFSRAFRRTTGLTFREFADALRISRAIEEMLRSDQSLTQIAHAVGFVSLTNLERAFRRRLGVSPSTYRKGLLARNGFSAGGAIQAGERKKEKRSLSSVHPPNIHLAATRRVAELTKFDG